MPRASGFFYFERAFLMNPYLVFIILVITGSYLINLLVIILNLRAMDPQLPEEFRETFDNEKYSQSQNYTRETSRFELISSAITTVITIIFILAGGFNYVDNLARAVGMGSIYTGLIFSGILFILSTILNTPFSLYSTFVIEEKFGFNRTDIKTFLSDLFKTTFLTLILGGIILAGVLWFFETGGKNAWIWCWAGVFSFMFLMQFLAPVLIMPLFNKFTPLEQGRLRQEIEDYARRENFKMQGVYTMDGSKRSSKLNAFFTGFGRFKRIVFYDTLLEKLQDMEIVAVLAHEMGHFKLKHIYKMLVASAMQTGIMFWMLSLFLNNKLLFDAFGMEHLSIYASIVFFGFLFTPVSMFVMIVFNIFSRKHEYEADAYAAKSSEIADELISALKKLSAENLSNLTPHPLYVFMNYSHPPVLARIRALKTYIRK